MFDWFLRKIPQYSNIEGFLHRWVVLKVGRFRVRIHNIRDVDVTPFLHNHPFHYVSIVISGGYIEQVLVDDKIVSNVCRFGKVIIGSSKKYHKIVACLPNTYTVFFAWYTDEDWKLITHSEVIADESYSGLPDGIYIHNGRFKKRENGRWFVPCSTPNQAKNAVKLSIYQQIIAESVKLYEHL